jgi:hypothetical protein
MASSAKIEAAKLEAAARASTAEAAKRALRETKKPKTQQAGTGSSTRAAARAAGARSSISAQVHPAPPTNTKNPRAPSKEEDQQRDIVDWDLKDEDALP